MSLYTRQGTHMKRTLAISTFVIGTLCAPFGAVAADSDSDRSKPMTFVKDSVITTKVKAKLAAEKAGTLLHISVDTDKQGVVWLSGKATTQADIDKAVSIATATEGVTSVKTSIKVSAGD